MKKVIVCDAIHPVGFEILRAQKDIEVIDATSVPKDELPALVKGCDVAITRSSTDCGKEFINSVLGLKALVRAGVGVDNVDIDECSKHGIIVMNVPTANTIAAVEMTMCHLLNSARNYVASVNDLQQNKTWKREKWYGTELFGKTLGIIGFGNIGSRVGVRALGFGMKVITYDPYIEPSKATSVGVEYTKNFDDILKCDFITIHTPKNKETINMIDEEQIAKMKDGVRLINCARGGLYNEDALLKNLQNGKIAFAGIDVFVKEPGNTHPLLDLANVSATPHLGANTLESQENIARDAAEQAIQAARGICYPNALNLPIKTEELPAYVEPFIELTSKIAYFAAQLSEGAIKNITLFANGDIAEHANNMLAFALVGALKSSLGEAINYVNASFVAEEKGIETAIQTKPASGYKNKISVQITTDNGSVKIGGTVFGDDEQRIVTMGDFKTDFKPKGRMIVFKNTDVPGVIRDVSSILASANINIADFRLGRGDGGALAVILVDQEVSKEVLAKLNALETCIWARCAEL